LPDDEAGRIGDAVHDLGIDEFQVALETLERAFQRRQRRGRIERGDARTLRDHLALASLRPIIEPEIDGMMRGKPRQPCGRCPIRVHDFVIGNRQLVRHPGGDGALERAGRR
jgi:hypothetical protein